jgi:target of rapamycin complex subunit LST8
MAIYPEKTLLAAGGYQHVSIYDIRGHNEEPYYTLDGLSKNTVSIGFEEHGRFMYTAGEDKSLKLWDMRSSHINCVKYFNHTHPITCAILHPNQFDFYIGDDLGNIFRWDSRNSQREQSMLTPESAIRSISINQEGNLIACLTNDGLCCVWKSTETYTQNENEPRKVNNSQDKQFQAHTRYGLKCLFSPDSTLLATSSADGMAKIWRTIDYSLNIECKDVNQKWVWDMAFTNDSDYLFTASSDNMARLWSVQTGEIKKDYVGHQKPIVCLAFLDT